MASEAANVTQPSFDDLTEVYESLVDWPRRLVRESPFYRRLFADHDVERVVDVACGTGHHAAMFHDWGLQVEGADMSPVMIDRARHMFGEPPGLRWSVRGFEVPNPDETLADAGICVGNSLALAVDQSSAQRAVREMMRSVRPGGIIIIHLLNLWSLPDGPCVWQKCNPIEQAGAAAIVIKGVHRSGSQGFVDLIVNSVSSPEILISQSVPLLGLTADQIDQWAHEAGAKSVQFHGDYQRASYEQESSSDLIAVIESADGS